MTQRHSEQMLLKQMMPIDLARCRVAKTLLFVKNAVSVKPSKAKHNKVRYAYMLPNIQSVLKFLYSLIVSFITVYNLLFKDHTLNLVVMAVISFYLKFPKWEECQCCDIDIFEESRTSIFQNCFILDLFSL